MVPSFPLPQHNATISVLFLSVQSLLLSYSGEDPHSLRGGEAELCAHFTGQKIKFKSKAEQDPAPQTVSVSAQPILCGLLKQGLFSTQLLEF